MPVAPALDGTSGCQWKNPPVLDNSDIIWNWGTKKLFPKICFPFHARGKKNTSRKWAMQSKTNRFKVSWFEALTFHFAWSPNGNIHERWWKLDEMNTKSPQGGPHMAQPKRTLDVQAQRRKQLRVRGALGIQTYNNKINIWKVIHEHPRHHCQQGIQNVKEPFFR